jgi:hypothetical protein
MNQCNKWMQVLKDAIFELSPKLELKKLDELQDRTINLFKTFREPEFDKDGIFIPSKPFIKPRAADGIEAQPDLDDLDLEVAEDLEMEDELRKEMDLPEGTLVTNLFVPCAVVCSKVDLIQHGAGPTKNLLETNLDYIQVSLRKFCLSYGAALAFVSTKSKSNVDMLYNYVISRLYDQEFRFASNTADKEALFVPTGLDSLEMIEGTTDLTSFLKKVQVEKEKSGEDI